MTKHLPNDALQVVRNASTEVAAHVSTTQRELTWFEKARVALEIPDALKGKPLLYMSAHRGAYDARIPGHLEQFAQIFKGGEKPESNKVKGCVDLSTCNTGEMLSQLRDFVMVLGAVNVDETALPAPGKTNSALPGFIVNVQFLPPLENNGANLSRNPQITWALDAGNVRHILPKLRDFLAENGYLESGSTLAYGGISPTRNALPRGNLLPTKEG